ncbi:hypothetical protein [Candidatus Viridilinea mediisalina]|uniref:Glycosyltransferase RgtA/B/C/D-like domain-containing protein n=1 Tax=Candidatus Viridilinea mediisalina TaxID=2024553 RepID=A0A2A6RIF0_9CHLR|nr:hypothetical protein [Candidatus Viridilinea mediisalina]PDW02721.1 hypothetical protein CJ255_12495 [Candidatus Viridilinea mediisalina]
MLKHLRNWGLLPILGLFLLHAWLYADFFIDDAFISLRYVQQWLAGNGLVYNIGEYVEGYSNFLWVVLVALLGFFEVDLILATRIWGISLSILTMILVYIAVRGLPFPLFAPLLLALSPSFAMWAMGGLENPLFMLLLLVGSLLFYREETQKPGWSSSICWGLLALTRPDGLLFGAIAFCYRVGTLYRNGQWPQRHDYLRGLVLAGIVLPHLLWRFSYYGYWLPNTIYAKSMGLNLRTLLEGGLYLYTSSEILGGLFVIVLLLLLALTAKQRHGYTLYFTLNVGAYAAFIMLAGGDWMPAQRFLASILPLLAILLQLGAVELVTLLRTRLPQPIAWSPILLHLLYIAAMALTMRFIEPGIPINHRLSLPYAWVLYLEDAVEITDTIAVFDAGLVSYAMPLTVRIVDMVGLADGHIAHRPPQFPGGLWGRGDAWGRWDVDYVLAQNPRFIQTSLQGMDAQGMWRTGFTGTTQLVNDPRFQAHYTMTELNGLFERK